MPERYEIKQSVLAQIDEVAGEELVYASSTSGLLISELQSCRVFQNAVSAPTRIIRRI